MEEWRGADVVEVCRRAIRGRRVDEESGESGQRNRRGVSGLQLATSSRTEISASLAWHGLLQLANRNFLLLIE